MKWIAVVPPAILAAIYLLTPAAQASPLGSWPLTPAGLLVFAVAIGVAFMAKRLPDSPRSNVAWIAAFALLMVVRATIGASAHDTGWLGRYRANDSGAGPAEWSSDFRFRDATRIDRALSFSPGQFPVHYLNGPAFMAGADRAVTEPMSVEWSGAFELRAPETVTVRISATGTATMLVDGSAVASTNATAQADLPLAAGPHSVAVRYRKAAGIDGSLQVDLRTQHGEAVVVFPEGAPPAPTPFADRAAAVVDGIAVLLLIAITVQTLAAVARAESRVRVVLGALVVVGLGAQGFIMALPFRRFHTLTGGDDWLGFESRSREILQHGLLMPLGAAIGSGVPYFYHPFYPYVLAAIHALGGESLFAPIFSHFLVLAITALVMFALARKLFGEVAAGAGVAALLVIFEVDFIRYYTITLLSENLYVLTVTCCLFAFARWVDNRQPSTLLQAGIWGGVSAATRPVMMVFLPLALLVTFAIAYRSRRGILAAPLILGASWMACVLPFTLRNWIVAKQFVLLSSGQGAAVIEHNVPKPLDPMPYINAFRSGEAGTVAVLWRLLLEHPAAFLGLQMKKLGFTLGMIQWFDGYRPHPELLAVTALYLAMLVISRTMRRPELWPVHAFVASHWASMALTSPWNYGYRLILPPYIYTTTLSCAAAVAWLRAMRPAAVASR